MASSVKALATTAGVLWGGALLTVGLARLLKPSYGSRFMSVIASVYPGYRDRSTVGNALLAGLYGFVDAAIGAALFGWLYRAFSGETSSSSSTWSETGRPTC